MALPKVLVVFFCFIATGLCCQLSSVCDSQCEQLELNITNARAAMNFTYRLMYHVATPVGWMNDPNGFVYYKGKYHIFYQFYPYKGYWGPMHWGHSISNDLVNWETVITALIPGKELCFSGSAVVLENTLVLMYTGHILGTPYNESQYLAFSDDGIHFHKYVNNPVLKSPYGAIDFRDPKVWKHGNNWYVVIGTRTTDGRGRVELYNSPDLAQWTFLSVIGESKNISTMGYMWECPDFFELNGKYVLLMSPQGMTAVGDRYKNQYQTGYIVGNFSYDTFKFVPETDFQELDFGHDFYATQTTENGGKRYLIGWFGMWGASNEETYFPEAAHGWAGALTLFRELQLSENRLLMKPVENMTSLRDKTVWNTTLSTSASFYLNKTGELIVNASWASKTELLFSGLRGGGNVTLKWDPSVKKVIVDRAGTIRQVEWTPRGSWRIFLDTSSVELFCGDGEVVFSSRVYPTGGWVVKNLSPAPLTSVVAYTLKSSVPA